MRANKKIGLTIALVAIFFSWGILKNIIAAPVSDRILESVDIMDDIDRSEVTIKFSFPFRYDSHFPKEKGDELRINLRPINVSQVDADALLRRESLIPRQTDLVPLESVVYEGNFSSNPLGTDTFNEAVDRRLEIRLSDIQDELDALSEAEKLRRISEERRKIVNDLNLEIRDPSDKTLYLNFGYEVAFGVEQGGDFRSIVVYVCDQEYSHKLKRCLDY